LLVLLADHRPQPQALRQEPICCCDKRVCVHGVGVEGVAQHPKAVLNSAEEVLALPRQTSAIDSTRTMMLLLLPGACVGK